MVPNGFQGKGGEHWWTNGEGEWWVGVRDDGGAVGSKDWLGENSSIFERILTLMHVAK